MKSQLRRDMLLNDVPLRDTPPQKLAAVAAVSIKIEKGIPIPTAMRAPKPCPYPFDSMEIGDSFAIAVPIGAQAADISKLIRSRLSSYMRQHPQFAGAVRIEKDERSVRFWRVEKRAGVKVGRPSKAA
jgi:hypothetical protein